jgi:hypothetical protein
MIPFKALVSAIGEHFVHLLGSVPERRVELGASVAQSGARCHCRTERRNEVRTIGGRSIHKPTMASLVFPSFQLAIVLLIGALCVIVRGLPLVRSVLPCRPR